MEFFTQTIQYWIVHVGPAGVFLASVLEEVISIIPSSLVQILSGSFMMMGYNLSFLHILLLIIKVTIPAALGVTIGSLPYVWLARKYGITIIDRWGKWIGVSVEDVSLLQERFEKTKMDDIVFVLMRAFPVIPSVALAIYGGVIKMSWLKYGILSFLGVCIRATVLGFVGWMSINALDQISSGVDHMEKIGLVTIGCVTILTLILLKRKKK